MRRRGSCCVWRRLVCLFRRLRVGSRGNHLASGEQRHLQRLVNLGPGGCARRHNLSGVLPHGVHLVDAEDLPTGHLSRLPARLCRLREAVSFCLELRLRVLKVLLRGLRLLGKDVDFPALVVDQFDHGRRLVREGSTRLFITPGYRLRTADHLLTNFHLPESTLFVLVSALQGPELAQAAYAEAVRERYRFFSYGDAMLILNARTLSSCGDAASRQVPVMMGATSSAFPE